MSSQPASRLDALRLGPRVLLRRLWSSWATRSLAVGAVATVLDLALGTSLLLTGVASTRAAAMTGTAFGALFGYFANRYFAFRDHDRSANASAVRFALVALTSTLIHGQLVVWMRDSFGVPFVVAKMVADVLVFNVGQLLMMRYLVFPKKQDVVEALGLSEATPPPTEAEVG
jgi:putative flippase GtrA